MYDENKYFITDGLLYVYNGPSLKTSSSRIILASKSRATPDLTGL